MTARSSGVKRRRASMRGSAFRSTRSPHNMQMDIDRLCLEKTLGDFIDSGTAVNAYPVYCCCINMFPGRCGRRRAGTSWRWTATRRPTRGAADGAGRDLQIPVCRVPRQGRGAEICLAAAHLRLPILLESGQAATGAPNSITGGRNRSKRRGRTRRYCDPAHRIITKYGMTGGNVFCYTILGIGIPILASPREAPARHAETGENGEKRAWRYER